MKSSTKIQLPPEEKKLLAKSERIVRKNLKGCYAVAAELARIRDLKLYRGKYSTFQEYCEKRWRISKSRAYQLCGMAGIVNDSDLSTVVDKNRVSGRAILALGDVPAEARAQTLESAVTVASEEGRAVTASDIAEAFGPGSGDPESPLDAMAGEAATQIESPAPATNAPAMAGMAIYPTLLNETFDQPIPGEVPIAEIAPATTPDREDNAEVIRALRAELAEAQREIQALHGRLAASEKAVESANTIRASAENDTAIATKRLAEAMAEVESAARKALKQAGASTGPLELKAFAAAVVALESRIPNETTPKAREDYAKALTAAASRQMNWRVHQVSAYVG